MRELAVQAANGTLSTGDRGAIQKEITSLIAEVDRIASSTDFNTTKLLDGSNATTAIQFQVGANSGQTVAVTISDASTSALGISAVNLATATGADAAISLLDAAIKTISDNRASLGAAQNRLEHTISNLGVAAENLTASESRIRDVDMAQQMMQFTKTQILQQAGTAMLAQANQAPQTVLQLLK
jgi:flagellin